MLRIIESYRIVLGEIIGTFILVLIGTGSVAVAVLFQSLNLYQIAGVWAVAVTFGIYASKNLSNAHLNPAVSIGFLVRKELTFKNFITYIIGQFIGGIFASFTVYLVFSSHILEFEQTHSIIRGTESSKITAMMFGEFYPNPGNIKLQSLSTNSAFVLEAVGTFVLMLIILLLTNSKKNRNKIIPSLIGLTVGVLIVFIAPYTQAGFNPARDFSPRLVSFFMGWGNIVFNLPQMGWLTVYIIAPSIGAALAACLHKKYLS